MCVFEISNSTNNYGNCKHLLGFSSVISKVNDGARIVKEKSRNEGNRIKKNILNN